MALKAVYGHHRVEQIQDDSLAYDGVRKLLYVGVLALVSAERSESIT